MSATRRSMLRGLVLGLLATCALAAGAHGAVSQTLYTYFDVDGGLQFRYSDSSNVGSTIPPGTYTINLNNNGADDLGVDHIFHLTGPGVDYKAANVTTNTTFSVTFQGGGTYRVFDDLDPKISLTILATNAPGTTSTTALPSTPATGSTKATAGGIVGSQATPARGSVDAIVSATGKLTLTRNGKTVKLLKPGSYTFLVKDKSRTAGFTVKSLRGMPVSLSTVLFLGSRKATMILKPGSWFFYTAGGQKTSFAVSS